MQLTHQDINCSHILVQCDLRYEYTLTTFWSGVAS